MQTNASIASQIESDPPGRDPAFFQKVVNQYYEDLYRFAMSLAKSTADASDLTQETFFVFAAKGSQLRDKSKAKSWLFTTLYHEFLRRRRKDGRLVFTEDAESYDGRDASQSEGDKRFDSQLVLEALSTLDENYRVPLTLFYLQGMAYKEIAEMLDVPIGTVMSRLSRAKSALRKAMEDPKESERWAIENTDQRVIPINENRKGAQG